MSVVIRFDQFRQAFPAVGDRFTTAALIDTYREHQPALTFAPGIEDLLGDLRGAGLRLGVVSDGPIAARPRRPCTRSRPVVRSRRPDRITGTRTRQAPPGLVRGSRGSVAPRPPGACIRRGRPGQGFLGRASARLAHRPSPRPAAASVCARARHRIGCTRPRGQEFARRTAWLPGADRATSGVGALVHLNSLLHDSELSETLADSLTMKSPFWY